MTDHHDSPLGRIDYGAIEADGPMPPMTRELIQQEAREGLLEIRDLITSDEFILLLDELYSLSPGDRDRFVREVILDEEALSSRGIEVPPGLKVQRSHFGDDRPTIFCVTKLLSDDIRKVTYTFDSASALATAPLARGAASPRAARSRGPAAPRSPAAPGSTRPS